MAVKRVSSEDVARAAGVSRTTVSFVLNNTPGKTISEETRRKVLDAAQELRYTPNERARNIAMAKHFSIGFFIPHSGYLSSDAYIIRIIEGMTPVLNKNRFQLVLQPLKLQEMNYLQLARQDAVDGIILMNTHDDDVGLAQVIEEGFPLVVIGSIKNRDVCQIDIDNRSSAAVAVNYMIDLGHNDIGMIIHAPLSYYAARDRYDGFRLALETAGYSVRKQWVAEANLTEESGYDAMNVILAQNRHPSAVFAGNDVVAYGAIQAIKDAGLRIPEDISIVGFDDDSLSRYLNPPLTTMTNPAASLGAEAASLIVKVMKGRRPAELSRLVPTSLAVRDSCRDLRSRGSGGR
ncbi:MAG TPA: LacI family DNA-binding transcriptional regulator [Spirochaetia bacterium]|nr:LacI family DNA-binding transcriptional regulator [Spirochaetia bacterium]